MYAKRNLLGGFIEPPKELTEEEKKKQEEFKASTERIKKVLSDFKDDSVKRITEILNECKIYSPEEDKFLIDNLSDSQKIVDNDVQLQRIAARCRIYARLFQTVFDYSILGNNTGKRTGRGTCPKDNKRRTFSRV